MCTAILYLPEAAVFFNYDFFTNVNLQTGTQKVAKKTFRFRTISYQI